MTPCTLTEIENGVLELENKGIKAFLKYNPGKVTLDIETIDLEDEWLKPVWGDRIYRILLRSKNPPLNDKWNIIITH